MTGMDTRIGYPNEHLAQEVSDELASPMYATGIGLVIEGISRFGKDKEKDGTKNGEKKKVKDKKGPKRPSFLKQIQDWFERDELE
jgi:cell division protein FtsA